MLSVPARTGRHRQRYKHNFRLVAGCIPYRITESIDDEEHRGTNIENKIQVLMVSSPDRDDRVFPKGGWEDDETILEAACREAFEEAGVKGKLRETPLGVWEFRSKSRQDMCSLEGGCRGYMFSLEVTEELEYWPEKQNRDRKWLNIKEAFRVCRYEWMRRALEQFLRVMVPVEDDIDGTTGEVVVVNDDDVRKLFGESDEVHDESKFGDSMEPELEGEPADFEEACSSSSPRSAAMIPMPVAPSPLPLPLSLPSLSLPAACCVLDNIKS